MNWYIPAKTFLIGEYAAVVEGPAILVTTAPYFTVELSPQPSLVGIHPESPAGLWWSDLNLKHGLLWSDPYQGCGGLGASSAQFVGSYLASCFLKNLSPTLEGMLEAYYQCAWNGQGLRPSGYDLIAQTQFGCTYINKQKDKIESLPWNFKDLSFFLIHTGSKLATHHHLQKASLPHNVNRLSFIADKAKEAFEEHDSNLFIECINNYHYQLKHLQLVAPHTLNLIEDLREYPEVLAIKGCGALGADIVLVILKNSEATSFRTQMNNAGIKILATENELTTKKEFNVIKRLSLEKPVTA